jgi:hypothetical protein
MRQSAITIQEKKSWKERKVEIAAQHFSEPDVILW